jgi:hypothetical protein
VVLKTCSAICRFYPCAVWPSAHVGGWQATARWTIASVVQGIVSLGPTQPR